MPGSAFQPLDFERPLASERQTLEYAKSKGQKSANIGEVAAAGICEVRQAKISKVQNHFLLGGSS